VVYTVNKPDNFEGRRRMVFILKQVFANQYTCLAESKSLIIRSSSVEKVHFKVLKFV
jgi:hypothetical protein